MTKTFQPIQPLEISGIDYWGFYPDNNIIIDDISGFSIDALKEVNATTTIAPPRRIYPAETYQSNEPIEQRIWWNKDLETENKWVSWFFIRRGAMLFFKGNAFRNNDFEGWLHEHPRNTDDCKVQAVIGDHRTTQISTANYLFNLRQVYKGSVAVIQDEVSDQLDDNRHGQANWNSAKEFGKNMPPQREAELVHSHSFKLPSADKVAPREAGAGDTDTHKAIRDRAVAEGEDNWLYHGGRQVIDAIKLIGNQSVEVANPTADDPRHIPFIVDRLNTHLGHGLPPALPQRSGTREMRGRIKTDFSMLLDACRNVLMERRVFVPNIEGELLPYDCPILADDREAILRDICEEYHSLLAVSDSAGDTGSSITGLLVAFQHLDFSDIENYEWNGGV